MTPSWRRRRRRRRRKEGRGGGGGGMEKKEEEKEEMERLSEEPLGAVVLKEKEPCIIKDER